MVIVKHNNPCGVGRGADLAAAYRRAFDCDPVSAFGSIVALNRPADGALAEAMADLFVEVLVAPGFDDGRPRALRGEEEPAAPRVPALPAGRRTRSSCGRIDGGFLAQAAGRLSPTTRRAGPARPSAQPTAEERRGLELRLEGGTLREVERHRARRRRGQTVGIGAGQMSRVDSCRLAVEKAQLPLAGTVAASDAFFPFRDGLDALAEAGITAVVQPGGSKRDDEVIAAADEHGIAMLFTGQRHFRH